MKPIIKKMGETGVYHRFIKCSRVEVGSMKHPSIEPTISHQTQENCTRFKRKRVAERYPSAYRAGNRRDVRERDAILRCLDYIPGESHVLDFPCGSGRLIRLIKNKGHRVSAADASASMLELAKNNCGDIHSDPNLLGFHERDVFNSGFADGEFDAVICNRLFHHLNESEDRIAALKELARISRGVIIVSFFNSFSISFICRKLRKKIKGRSLKDRIPIPMADFSREAHDSGLRVAYSTAARWGVSPLWYLVLEKEGKHGEAAGQG